MRRNIVRASQDKLFDVREGINNLRPGGHGHI